MDVDQDQRSARKATQLQRISFKEKQRAKVRQINKILKKTADQQTEEERKILAESTSLVQLFENRKQKKLLLDERSKEIEDPIQLLEAKCLKLAEAIKRSKFFVVYTGAGISTAAQIPDYRGPNGIWTQLNKSGSIANHCDLALAEPTYTHMAIAALCRSKIVKHIVSQNCDGLHLRSCVPQEHLSEIHGNMFIEVCNNCKTQYLREFDVTEKTSLHRHKTGRSCHSCGENGHLIDTIVHFGERGRLAWPLNWTGAAKAAASADLILCLGSSLKILRKYHCLWPKRQNGKPELCIVNLQWTPKDSQANLKINGKCDTVIREVMKHLSVEVDAYSKTSDPIYQFSTPLRTTEQNTCNRIKLFDIKEGETEEIKNSVSYSPSWFGKGLKRKK